MNGAWSPPPPLLLEEVEKFCEKLQGFFGDFGRKSTEFLRNYVKESEVRFLFYFILFIYLFYFIYNNQSNELTNITTKKK